MDNTRNQRSIQRGIAIVSGASSGIGAAFARHLAAAMSGRERYSALPSFDELWIVARRGDRLTDLAEEIRRELGEVDGEIVQSDTLTIRTFPADLTAPGTLETLANRARESEKPIRVLINNAGYGTYGPFSENDLNRQLGQVDLNCRARTQSCGLFDPLLESGSWVLNVASLAAFAPLGGFAVYAATKAYVLSLSVALGSEWKSRGIRVLALCPGPVESEFAKVASNGAREIVLHGWSPDKTVIRALRDCGRGKRISLPKFSWKLQRWAAALAGPVLSSTFAQAFLQRPRQKSPGNGRAGTSETEGAEKVDQKS
jgi:short-subunit dehydrogenase